MFETEDMHAVGLPGRTETMIPLVRKTFGDDMVLYADSLTIPVAGGEQEYSLQ